MRKHWWIFVIVSPLFALLLLSGQVYYLMTIWKTSGEKVEFTIKPGETFASINYRLKKSQLISSSKLFHRYSQYQGIMTKFRPGTYEISPGVNLIEMTDLLLTGKTQITIVTIPEGKNIYDIAKIMASLNVVAENEFLSFVTNPQNVQNQNIPGETFEGYLYPDTYHFSPGTTSQQIVSAMLKQFKLATQDISFNHPFLDPHETIILASIVEKETGADFERPKIAGVFLNRLKKKMRLQSDPTTIYGLLPAFDGNLKKIHLLQVTPFNTYAMNGLPRGPIANPGKAAINAVLNPEAHDYLYFVSYNDGTHKFSKTYQEHLMAVEKYQKDHRARNGKSWRDLKK
jgi:UPF0755 protein